MRLFTETAFFINLLNKTLSGIKAFSVMMIILVMCIANVMYILNLEDQSTVNEEASLYSLHLPYDFANAVIFAYNLAIGEYDSDNFKGEHQNLLWIIYAAATFMLQITFLNMLIAIMSNTFDQVLAEKKQSAMNEKINILNDFRLILEKMDLKMNFQYIFLIKPRS